MHTEVKPSSPARGSQVKRALSNLCWHLFVVLVVLETATLFVLPTITGRAFQLSIGAGVLRIAGWLSNTAIATPRIDFVWQMPSWYGWHFFVGKEGTGIAIEIPLWILYGTLALLAILLYRRSLPRANVCSHCGYPIATSASICPECGATIDPSWRRDEKPATFWKHHRISCLIAAGGIGLTILLVCSTFVVEQLSRTEVSVTIPNGYRGDIVIVQDSSVPNQNIERGGLSFVVPASGVLRVKDSSYFETRDAIEILCKEQSGLAVSPQGSGSGGPWFKSYGPIGDYRVVVLSIRTGDGRSNPRISPELRQHFAEQGVPEDFVSPHVIQPDPASSP